MLSANFPSPPTLSDDDVKRELIQIVAMRLFHAAIEPLHLFGLPETPDNLSLSEQNAANSIYTYMRDLQTFFEDYFTSLDVTTALATDTLNLRVVAQLAPALEQDILKAYEKKLSDASGTDANQDPLTFSDTDEGEDDWAAEEGEASIPDCIPSPERCDPTHVKAISRDLGFINECYYHSWITGETEGDVEEPGSLAGFNAAYLWVKQALDDLHGMQPEQLYLIKVMPKAALAFVTCHRGGFTPPHVSCTMQ